MLSVLAMCFARVRYTLVGDSGQSVDSNHVGLSEEAGWLCVYYS